MSSKQPGPRPEGPRDAALADPPSSEAAHDGKQSKSRTPGLGSALPAPERDGDHQSGEQED
jgi:hypothetical protein